MRRRVLVNRFKPKRASAIDRINELSSFARANWFGLLAYMAFAGVTLLSVHDADFFVSSRQTTLPLIGVEIPTKDFFIFGPILGTALYVYLHLYLIKLWEALADAPPRPNGAALSLQVTPWLVNEFGLALRGNGAFHHRPLDWLSHLVTFLLAFAVGPIVTAYFWIRFWPAHELGHSIFNAILFTLTTMTMLTSLFAAVTRLRFSSTFGSSLKLLLATVTALAILVPSIAITVAKSDGPESLGPFRALTEKVYSASYRFFVGIGLWAEPVDTDDATTRYALRIASADLREVEFVSYPANWQEYWAHQRQFRVDWCAQQGIDPTTCGPFERRDDLRTHTIAARKKWCENNGYSQASRCARYFSDLYEQFDHDWTTERLTRLNSLEPWSPQNKDLRNADLTNAVLPGADLRGADMDAATLKGAQMEGVNLRNAHLENSNFQEAFMVMSDLRGAQLRRADLSDAWLVKADLRGSQLELADLNHAWILSAKLHKANLVGADLSHAELSGADLREAQIVGADLRSANLVMALLYKAQLNGADLSDAWLSMARLQRAQLEGANLSRSSLDDANLESANLKGADLRSAFLSGADFYDSDLTNADMRDASILGATFIDAQMKGADLAGASIEWLILDYAKMNSVNWTETSFTAMARFADLRGIRDLRQEQLLHLIGNSKTLLPDQVDPETGQQLYIPSCWAKLPDAWPGHSAEAKNQFSNDELIEDQILCAPGTLPQRSGTPWSMNQLPPWEVNDLWEPDIRGPVTASEFNVEKGSK